MWGRRGTAFGEVAESDEDPAAFAGADSMAELMPSSLQPVMRTKFWDSDEVVMTAVGAWFFRLRWGLG